SKLDLLVRVRYQNPLPAPPYPPKLLHIPTNPERYATIEYTGDLANEMAFPMVVDAEMGMPIDLSRYESLWQEGGDASQLNPNPDELPPVDLKDEFLLEGSNIQAGPSRPSSQYATGSTPLQVSWLRRTEYVTAKDSGSRVQVLSRYLESNVDISREAQIRDVEATFPPTYHGIDISKLKHPTQPQRKAVEFFELLPDPETFATPCDIFRFPERPGERPLDQQDPRLESALLRPVRLDDGENFIAYYLVRDDSHAVTLKTQRSLALEMNIATEDPPIPFDLIRDYEIKVSSNDQSSDLVLFFDDGTLPPHVDAIGSTREYETRAKGVYYKSISRRHNLKRRRPNEPTEYSTKTDVINLSYRAMDESERVERYNELEEILNPLYEPPEEEEDEEIQPPPEKEAIVEDDDMDI
ncbi:Paf1-domain-containing protein, partial [Serendipita vermifera]